MDRSRLLDPSKLLDLRTLLDPRPSLEFGRPPGLNAEHASSLVVYRFVDRDKLSFGHERNPDQKAVTGASNLLLGA